MVLHSRHARKATRIALCFVVSVGLLGLSGCNSWLVRYYLGEDYIAESAIEKDPAQLAVEGTRKMREKDYDEALKAFQQLKERYPYSKYAILAELKVGDAYFHKGDYAEAAIAYEEFARLHPRNEIVPYVSYQIGMCHFLSFRSIDRDQEETRLAIDSFKRLIQVFPDSQYARKGEKQLLECYKRLAAQELYVARFYFRRGDYSAAKRRLDVLVSRYPEAVESLHYQEEIQEMLAESERQISEGEKKESLWSRMGF